MEGIAGVFTDAQVTRGTAEHVKASKLMTLETNAAIKGAFDGGATSVVVSDAHGEMDNLYPDLLDSRATLVQGSPKWPWGMMTGLQRGFFGAVFVGYHAKAGTSSALMDHTFTTEIMDVRVNEESFGEIGINAMLSATLGVPVLAVCGDDAACAEASQMVPSAKIAAVKSGIGRFVAESMSPADARVLVRETVRQAVDQVSRPTTMHLGTATTVEVDVARTVLAELFTLVPGTERIAPRTVRFSAEDYETAYMCLMAWCQLIKSVSS